MKDLAALYSVFAERATAAGAMLHPIAAELQALKQCLEALQLDHPMVAEAFPFTPAWVKQGVDEWSAQATPVDTKALVGGGTGITDVFAGVAETGSIALSNLAGLHGALSLFTDRHIALLEIERLVARPRDLFTKPEWARELQNMVFITGPSATADMGKLVRGVHGPGRLDIIVLGAKV
jgi:L-lactate dehydrogenase complex protein LldG